MTLLSKRYVIGFMFSPDFKRVVLVKKNRPAWQNGLWNGVGGHIEPGEFPLDAMKREFVEETGVAIDKQGDWRQSSYMTNGMYSIDIFATVSEHWDDATTMTDEPISVWHVEEVLRSKDTIFNIPWLLLMAREQLLGRDLAVYRIEH